MIDPVAGTIYVEARTRELSGGVTNYFHRLHALDITTGLERSNSPVVIAATNYPGLGGGTAGTATARATCCGIRSRSRTGRGLLLLNGRVYISYAEPGDKNPWHGWVFAYDATTLAQTGVICLTPNGKAGGVWMAGGAPAADTNGFIYSNTGNGDFETVSNNYADSYLKLSTTNGVQVYDYFTPNNQAFLQLHDYDVSSGGLVLLPDSVGSLAHPHLLFGGSKNNVLFLLDRDNLGQYNGVNDNQIVQGMTNQLGGMIFSGPAYFNGQVYMAANGNILKGFSIANAAVNTTPVGSATSTLAFTQGTTPTISANGTSNAIVWALNIDSYNNTNGTSILHALNATNLAQQLYSSSQIPARDNPGPAVHFTSPSVANGKVYVPSRSQVSVFGNAIFFPGLNPGTYSNDFFALPVSGTPGLQVTPFKRRGPDQLGFAQHEHPASQPFLPDGSLRVEFHPALLPRGRALTGLALPPRASPLRFQQPANQLSCAS